MTENFQAMNPRRNKSSINATCRSRRDLQSSFNAVKDFKEINEKSPNNDDSEKNRHFVYPRCSSCTVDRAPGKLRKFAATLCDVCNAYLCTSCTRKHRINCNGHLLSPITPKLDEKERFLTKNGHHQPVCHKGHRDVLKYFCETCQDVACLECIQTQHKKHEFVYAKDAYKKHKASLETHIQNSRVEANRIVKQLDQGEEIVRDLKTEKDNITEKIKAQTKVIMEVLRNREKDLLQDVDRIYSNKEDVLIRNKERLDNRLELIRRTCRFTEIAINDGDEVQLLIFEKFARKRLDDLCRTECLTPPETEGHCRYYVTMNSPEKAEQLLGKFICSAVDPSQCEACGEGLRRAVVGKDSSFMVNLRGKDGIPLNTGGDDVQAQITSTSEEGPLRVRVTDHDNGTYTVTYSSIASGVLSIAIHVYGEPIKTPRYQVHAVCQRDYEKIKKPMLSISKFILSGKELSLKLPCGVAVDDQGRILVADCHNHSIKIFSRDGKFIKSFGCLGSKNGQLNNPTDIAVNDRRIYVCDKDNSRIQCFTSEGVFLSTFACGSSLLKRPWGLCIDGKGHVVVTDTKNNQIQVFSTDGYYVTSFGKEGSGPCEFQQPYYVSAHPNGQIYITDNGNHRVQVFDESYSYLFEFSGDNDDLKLKYPTGITTDHQGHVIVADQCNNRIQVYKADGKNKVVISKPLNKSQSPSYPKGLAVTLDGFVVVADSDNDEVVLL
ncbi:tripartite motif-containing protein 2-like [Dendronephthya gigantea]|uniref:tripartite motif-containing protein 2-like n=1 Tax=Dendronephthya gigantea TaxID=151771 RepID=UPI00106907D1|nr:tripartite motif-containing protein 2-like [Dendronephthya gigantea]XP_028397310.1 tripartite motif-containing protein 2-like [Dendronephthya gigantea]